MRLLSKAPKLSIIKNLGYEKSTHETGKDFENRVKRYLENKGYRIIRHLRHCDWEATKNGKKYFIECKLRQTVNVSQDETIFLLKKQSQGHKVIIASKDRTGHVILKNFNYKKPKAPRKGKPKSISLLGNYRPIKIPRFF
jgi:hypothetical protein